MTEQNQNENFEIETIEETQAFETSEDAETENFTDELETEEVETEETVINEPQEETTDSEENETDDEVNEPETEETEVKEEEPKLKPSEICKSKAAFNDFILNNPMPLEICEIMQNYPKKPVVKIAELTQNIETLINTIGTEDFDTNQYLVWIVTRAKDEIVNTVKRLNGKDGLGIFIIRAYLYNDETESGLRAEGVACLACDEQDNTGKRPVYCEQPRLGFECLLKPELKEKVKRVINTETPAKQLQKEYWNTYFIVCDTLQSEIQVTPLPRHYQPVSIGVKGVQIMQTINTQKNYIAAEIGINNDKTLFEKLLEHKEEIESEVGELEWDSKESNKSAKIRKTYPIDIISPENHEKAAEEHVKMAEELTAIARKYL